MDLARPELLIFLTAAVGLVFLARRSNRRRARDWARLGASGRLRREPFWPVVLATAVLVVALAGPRWGQAEGGGLPPGHDVVLLVDVSRSMAAEDAVPDRLGAAVTAADGLIAALEGREGERVAVVAFAGRGVIKCPLTENLGAARDALRDLRPGQVQPGGTDLGNALVAALDVFDDQETAGGRTIVVFSDGEDHEDRWPKLVDRLRERRVIVHAVAVGDDRQGHPIPSGAGAAELVRNGEIVLTKRADDALETIRKATGGVLVPMGVARADLGSLYREKIAPSETRERAATRPPERADRSEAFILVGAGILAGSVWPKRRRGFVLAAAGLIGVGIGAGSPPGTPAQAVKTGDSAYRRGDYEAALKAFARARELAPKSAIPACNLGATLFQMGKYDEAEALYRTARESADPSLRARIDYALGNVAVARGHYPEALKHYDDCLKSSAEGLDPVKADAAINREFARKQVPPPPQPQPDEDGDRDGRGDRGKTPKSPGPKDDTSPGPGDPANPPPNPGTNPPPSATKADPKSEPPPQKAESPESDLDRMLDDVKKARQGRLDVPPPPASADNGRKDW